MSNRPTAARVATIVGAVLVAVSLVGVVYGGIVAIVAGRGIEGAYMLAFALVVALVVASTRRTSTSPVQVPEQPFLMPGEDAFLLANFLLEGDGTEATNLIYGSDYAAPVRLAQLLEQTAVVLRIKA